MNVEIIRFIVALELGFAFGLVYTIMYVFKWSKWKVLMNKHLDAEFAQELKRRAKELEDHPERGIPLKDL